MYFSVRLTVLFINVSELIGCENRLRNDIGLVDCVGVKLYSNKIQPSTELFVVEERETFFSRYSQFTKHLSEQTNDNVVMVMCSVSERSTRCERGTQSSVVPGRW